MSTSSDLPQLSSPAQQALANANITSLEQLSHWTENELSQLHGIGPSALKTLKQALKHSRLDFLL